MKRMRSYVTALVVVGTLLCAGCDDPSDPRLKGQVNTTITFCGLTVDHDGNPLQGVEVEYQVDAYQKDWTFETRGRPYETSTVGAVSDERGRFQFTVTGCILRRLKAERTGYRHFFDEDATTGASNYGYRLIAWGDINYKTDVEHPAIYVFVKDGIREVSALPCRGGYSFDGKQWTPNQPAWPKRPSLTDVVYRPPSTNPTTQPQRGGGE